MGKDRNVPKPRGGSQPPRRRDPRGPLKVINGILVGVGTLYLASGSVTVTIIGAVVATVLAALSLDSDR